MKDKLNELLQALIDGNNTEAKKALHEYLTSKSKSVLSEMGDYDDEGYDDEEGYDEEGAEGDVELELDAGDEGEGDVESRLADVEQRLDDVEDEVDGVDGGDEGEVDLDIDADVDADVDADRELSFDEEQEALVRRGRRRDKASKGRLRK